MAEAEIGSLLRTDPQTLARLLPPFGAVATDHDRSCVAVADALGFQPIFHSAPGISGPAVLASSARVAGWQRSASLDEASVGVQSLLGWQLGQHTLFDQIRKLSPGAVGSLDAAGVHIQDHPAPVGGQLDLGAAVGTAAQNLRLGLERLLDECPDAVLQLTGGMDSRILLSAIPRVRRRGLKAMTLSVPGAGDVAIARSIAQRYGLDHDVQDIAAIADVTPADAWDRACAEAVRLDAMADPIALAAQRIAEQRFRQGVRISGLGGEVARGFYYVGRVRERSYARDDAARLASWRMFVNDAVEPGLLTKDFTAWAREIAIDRVYEGLRSGGDDWYRATDTLYLRHRMQRWAGATDVAVSNRRTVINPMLDFGFIEIADRLLPRDKQNSRFLGLLQVELDPELGALPLDGRPAPMTYADPALGEPLLRAARTGKRLVHKALQRARRGNRPPAGGEILAAKVVEHLRANSGLVDGLSTLGFLDQDWLSGLLSGEHDARPSSVALLVNLVVALRAPEGMLIRD